MLGSHLVRLLSVRHHLCKPHCVLNLAPICGFTRQTVYFETECIQASGCKHVAPDLRSRRCVKRGIMERHSDARVQCWVKSIDAVGGEEQYATVVLQQPQ